MKQSPIPRVLSAFRRRRVKALLMGGQACIVYGGAEFTRDVDFAVAVSAENLARLRKALDDLKAEPLHLPGLSADVLRRGHACHFRCRARALGNVRVDVMTAMRGVESFDRLWARRVRVRLPDVGEVALLSLRDLVRAKKTQRDKDWPMIRRLIEADVERGGSTPAPDQVRWWLEECRTPELLADLVVRFRSLARRVSRAAVRIILRGETESVRRALRREEDLERAADRRYWRPLQAELERWRLSRPRPGTSGGPRVRSDHDS